MPKINGTENVDPRGFQFNENCNYGQAVCILNILRLWLKCIVGQSWAKLGKVDMFSKEIIKKQSWQSWCIFKYNMQSKIGKVQIWIFYYWQSWQSWDIIFLIMDKYQTPGKVGKVVGTFGIIWLLLRISKVGKVEK